MQEEGRSMVENGNNFQEERYLIINADDFGMSHSTNQAVVELLKNGYISSASIMMPCPWACEAAYFSRENPQFSVGIHLTFTSEWKYYKWGPATVSHKTNSLTDDYGFFYDSAYAVERYADPLQVRREIESQIKRALTMKVEPSHLDNHMGSLYGLSTGRDFLSAVFDFCEEYGLPFRLPKKPQQDIEQKLPFKTKEMLYNRIAEAESRGIMLPDYLIGLSTVEHADYDVCREQIINTLIGLKPGVTELYIHPAKDSEELRAITENWPGRHNEYLVFQDPEVKEVLVRENIKIISWKNLRDVQRRGKQDKS